MATFSERIRELRKERKATQFQMSQVCGIQPRSYQSYEYNQAFPDVPGLVRLADFFNVSTDYLLGRSDVREVQRAAEKTEE